MIHPIAAVVERHGGFHAAVKLEGTTYLVGGRETSQAAAVQSAQVVVRSMVSDAEDAMRHFVMGREIVA